jgi:zinc transporter 1/2/3
MAYGISGSQDWAAAIAMAAVYLIFFIEFAAYRIGTARLAKYNLNYCEFSHRAKRLVRTCH